MIKSRNLIVIVIILLITNLINAKEETINLDNFLQKVWIKYKNITKEKEILEIEKEIFNSSEPGEFELSGSYERDIDKGRTDSRFRYENDRYWNRADLLKGANSSIKYNKKFKFGPEIEIGMQNSYKDAEYYSGNYSIDTAYYSTNLTLNLTQSLFKNLIQEFYNTEYNELYFKSKQKIETAKRIRQ